MIPRSLYFSSIEETCRFLKAAKLPDFLLLCKQRILIARFSESELCLARDEYGAAPVQTPETSHLIHLCFN
ncbi:hypothetical protein [Flavisolibacter nicotianae]|uniref:hypothetical protein n=1 Tax=Flavisolibacter nicotianae TaxID=2364882 RepID=UPI0013C40C39|nr:hypothetical protein [Flavisolibacter nicotianae]